MSYVHTQITSLNKHFIIAIFFTVTKKSLIDRFASLSVFQVQYIAILD